MRQGEIDHSTAKVDEAKGTEQYYRTFFEEAPVMYVLTRNRKNVPVVADCNLLFTKVLGYSREEILGQPITDFYTPHSREELLQGGYQRALHGNFVVEERQLLCRDGQVIETVLHAMPEINVDGEVAGTRAMFMDISEYKRREDFERKQRIMAEVLREVTTTLNSSLDFEVVLDQLLEQIARVVPYDAANVMLVGDGRIHVARMHGYEQFGTPAVDEVEHLSFAIADTPTLQHMVDTGQPLAISDTSSYPDWKRVAEYNYCRSWVGAPIMVQDQVVAFFSLDKVEPNFYQQADVERLAIFSNQVAIAIRNAQLYEQLQRQAAELEQKVAERTAELEQQYYRQAALAQMELIISHPHKLQDTLERIAQITTQFLPTDEASLILWDSNIEDFSVSATTVPNQGPYDSAQRVRKRGGATHWIKEHHQPFSVSDIANDPFGANPMLAEFGLNAYAGVPLLYENEILGVLYALNCQPRTFTEEELNFLLSLANRAAIAIAKLRLYEQLQTANVELARTARLKDEFLANMSHELRTPLNAILGMSESLQEQVSGPLNTDQLDLLHDIEASGQHLLALINDILDLSKVEAGKLELQPTIVNVEAVCEASLRMVKQTAFKKKLKVLTSYDSSVSSINADERQLKQILVNLLSNAVKFTPEGGTVALEFASNPGQGEVHFTVWDTGIGISPEDMERLFEPFVQVDSGLARSYEGTGLGLALVRRLVELHGGAISVESHLAKGSRFEVSLPQVEAPPEDRVATEVQDDTLSELSVAQTDDSQPLILLAEDNAANIKTISKYLQHKGYRLIIARNGLEAIRYAQEQSPDLILMDVHMPEMDGLEAIRQLRADSQFAQVPIFTLTALAMPGDRERCLAAGANEYLSKPVRLRELVRTIKTYLTLNRED